MNTPPLHIQSGPAAHLHPLAAALVARRYRACALTVPDDAPDDAETLTLLAHAHHRICGTLTLRVAPPTLLAEAAYGAEIGALRTRHPRLAELTRLVIDSTDQARLIMAALFDHAWHLLHNRTDVDGALIEVHPRHAAFYARRFGFARVAGPRVCPRVCAPSVLLLLPLPALCALPGPRAAPPVGASRSRRECPLHL